MSDPVPVPDTIGVLPDYGGRKVLRTVIAIRNAGDGLSEGMAIDPEVLDIGSKHFVVLEVTTTGHNHKPMKGGTIEYLELEQVLTAGAAVIVDEQLVGEMIAEQRERVAKAKDDAKRADEAAKGVQRVPFGDELQAAHERGEHAEGLVEGCPDCDRESDAVEAEAAEAAEPTPISGRRPRRK